MASIFVQIPSYHDEELLSTIENLVNFSSGNNIINFGIHNSYWNEPVFEEKTLKSASKTNKISVFNSKFPDNIGAGISRYIANSFYDGEDYYLQTDSHMRFCKNWDEILIDDHYSTIENYGFDKLIISSYPSPYSYEKLDKNMNNINNIYYSITGHGKRIVIDKGSEIENFFNKVLDLNIELKKLKYYIGNTYVSGAYIFTSGDYSAISPNKQILHMYEEMLTGFRAYTHGFDVMPPRWDYCFHLYRRCIPNGDEDVEFIEYASKLNKRRFINHDIETSKIDVSYLKNIEEIKDIVLNNRIDDQGFGSERNFQDLMKKLIEN